MPKRRCLIYAWIVCNLVQGNSEKTESRFLYQVQYPAIAKLKTINTAEHIQEHYQSTHEKDNNIMMMMVMMQAFTFSILKQCACIDLCSLFYPGTFYLLPSTLMEGKILSSQFYRQGNWWIKQFIQDLKFKWQNWNLTACGL